MNEDELFCTPFLPLSCEARISFSSNMKFCSSFWLYFSPHFILSCGRLGIEERWCFCDFNSLPKMCFPAKAPNFRREEPLGRMYFYCFLLTFFLMTFHETSTVFFVLVGVYRSRSAYPFNMATIYF